MDTHNMNRTLEQITIGEQGSLTRSFETADLKAWGSATGEQVSAGEGGLGIIVAMLSGLASSHLPGPGTVIRSIQADLKRPIIAGDVIKAQLSVKEKHPSQGTVVLDACCTDDKDNIIANGQLEVLAPRTNLAIKASHSLDGLLELCKTLPPILTGVVWPLSEASLMGAIESAHLMTPIFYGPKSALETLANKIGIDLKPYKIEESPTPEEAAQKAAIDAGTGQLHALMKGSLHTDILLHAVLQKEAKLKTGRLLSHCCLISAPTYPERIVLSDVALNITPDIGQKQDICQNAIGFAKALGIDAPKVAILSAVETLNIKMPSTLDGAVLAKMAERGQIVGATVDGPLDFDAALDADAARIKHITSPVAGIANILIVPNIEAGNMVYKEFDFIADSQIAGLVVGARVPIILTSRADNAEKRRFSAAAAALYAQALLKEPETILGIEG